MATVKTCDYCGVPGAKTTEVHFIVVGAVTEGQPTGTSFASDLCDDCCAAESVKLHAKAVDQHVRHVPIQRELIALRAAMGDLVMEKNALVAARDNIKEGSADYNIALAKVDGHLSKIEANEKRQQELIAQATE
jgi:hypothetical protein